MTVTDGSGCTADASVTINSIDGPVITDITATSTDCGAATGTITITATGGGLQYSIDGGVSYQAGNVFAALGAGSYNVSVIDGSGCTSVGVADITTLSGPSIDNVANTPADCGLATGTITITATGSGLQYSIDGGVTYQGGNNFTGLAAGVYDVAVMDAGGCMSTAQTVVGTLTGPSIDNVANTPADCGLATGTITITATGGGLQYSIDGGITYQPSNTFTDLAAGAYTVTVADAGGCTVQAPANVGTLTGPSITNVSSTPAGCGAATGTITITATGTGLQYSIDGGITYQSSNTFIDLVAGAYTVTVADGGGCTVQEPASVGTTSGPSITNVATTPTDCGAATGTITVTATGTGLQYSLDGGVTYQPSNVFTGVGAGVYDVPVIDAAGCTSPEPASVGTLTGPTIDQVVSIPPGCGLANGSITIVATGTGLTYSIDGGSTFQASNVFNGLAAGSYDVVVSAQGCDATTTALLADGGGPSIDGVTPSLPLCNGDANGTLTVNASGTGPFQYSIDGGATFLSGPVNGGLPAGPYVVVVNDAGGCADTLNYALAEPAVLTLAITPTDPGCTGECTGGAVALGNGGTPGSGYQYTWPGTGTTGSPQATGLCAGTYPAGITDANGCTAAASFTLVDPAPFVIQSVQVTDESCPAACDGTAMVQAVGGAAYSIGGGVPQASPVFTGLCDGDQLVMAADANGCTTTTSATILPGMPVEAAFTVTPTVANTVDPQFVFTNQSTDADYYFWSFGIHGSSTQTDPVLYISTGATEFLACLIATNTAGCSDTACTRLVVLLDPTIYVPNAFTVGSDGLNDMFHVVGDPMLNEHFRLYIFNRWGEEIFYSEDITKGWDGTYNGQPCQQDVYPWRVEVRDPNTAQVKAYMGHVTLLR